MRYAGPEPRDISMPQFIVGTDAALAELLERSERIENVLLSIENTMLSFELVVDALADYAVALKEENALLKSNDADMEAALETAQAKVVETEQALSAANAAISADDAEENRLKAKILTILPSVEEATPGEQEASAE